MQQRDRLAEALRRAVTASEHLDWSDRNSVFNYASHRKTEAVEALAALNQQLS
jgi:hypothetical protein